MNPRRLPASRPGQEGGTRDQNRRRRVASIANAALELFLEHGIQAVTIDQIVANAHTAKGTFYRYFEGKEEVVDRLMEPLREALALAMDTCVASVEKASSERVSAAYVTLALDLAVLLERHPDTLRLYLQEARAPGFKARQPIEAMATEVRTRAIALTEAAWEAGLLAPRDPRVSALAVVGASEELLQSILKGLDLGPPPKVAAALVEMVLQGLAPNA